MSRFIQLFIDYKHAQALFLDTARKKQVMLASLIEWASAPRGMFDEPDNWKIYRPKACNYKYEIAVPCYLEAAKLSDDPTVMDLQIIQVPMECWMFAGYRLTLGVNYKLRIAVIPQTEFTYLK